MSDEIEFSSYEIDALRELTNIGMGRAGAQLSEIFEHRVTLSVPNVQMMNPEGLQALLNENKDLGHTLNIIQQSFLGDIEGRSN